MAIAPQMVFIPDNDGNYPIHLAIYNHHSYDILYQLYKQFPSTGKIEDGKSKLIPFMLAALGNWQNELDQLSIIYVLLREDPLLIFGV